MKTKQCIFVFYVIAFLVTYFTNLSEPRSIDRAVENVESGLRSLTTGEQDTGVISEICPQWMARLPGGCRRLLRLKRSTSSKKRIPKWGFCPPTMPRCPRKRKQDDRQGDKIIATNGMQ